MDALQQGIVTLIRGSLTGEQLALPERFDLETAYSQIVRHGIVALAYDGAVKCGVDKKLPVMQKLFHGYCRCLQRSEAQLRAIERICVAFDEAGIDYMPLKGCNLKMLYPKPELRVMGDADILVRTAQYIQIRPVMQVLGYEEQLESNHELIWNSRDLHLELHKRLIPSYNEDYYRYFGDGWRLAKRQKGTRYAMTQEDEYIYIFTHFAKHYRDGGIGCRHVTDLWVYRRACSQMDEQYIAAELDKLQLLEFERNIRRLTEVWFEDRGSDEKTDFIADFIFRSGSWGSAEAHTVSAGVKSASEAGSVTGGRARRVLQAAFPSAEALQNRYPVLRKYPALLPAIWPVRMITAALFRRDNIRKQRETIACATVEKIESYQQALNYVGLDFHFRED